MTDLRGREAERRQHASQRDRALLIAAGQIVWVTNASGSVLEDSPSWRNFTGQTFEQFRGSGWLDAVHPDDRDATQHAWEQNMARGGVFEGSYRVRTVDGRYRLLLSRAAPVQTADGTSEWVVLNFDLSDVERFARDHDELSARLEVVSKQQSALRELAAYLSQALTTQEVVQAALVRSPELLGASGALIVMTTEQRGLRVVGQRDMPRDAGANWRVVPVDADFPAAHAIRSGRRVGIAQMDESGPYLDTIPFEIDGRIIGAITFAWQQVEKHDAEFVADVTSVIGQALERAQNFEREQSIAVSLQRSMLPSTLPRVDGAELGATYLPGSDEADVGGDWFESILLDDGRLLLAVGDVMGKGLPAASTMSEFRYALKALSVVSSSPGQLLRHLATYHGHRSGDKDQLLTIVLAVIDPKTRELTWASAGHIPPYLVQPVSNSAVPLDDAQGLPLGLGVEWSETSRQMADGELLMLASDGLVEDRRRSLDAGLLDLQLALASLEVTSAAQVCDRIVEHMVGEGTRDDDVTVLCLRIDARITAAGWALPATPESVPRARGLVAAELTRFGIEDPEVFETVKLLTSELVTNAIRHSHDDIMVCLDRVDRLLRVTVADANADLRLEPKPAQVEGQGGRGLLLVEALATDWGVTPQVPGKQVWFELEIDR